jgi:hypothetical protein
MRFIILLSFLTFHSTFAFATVDGKGIYCTRIINKTGEKVYFAMALNKGKYVQIIKSFKNDVFGYYITGKVKEYTTTKGIIYFLEQEPYGNTSLGELNRKNLVFKFRNAGKNQYTCNVFNTFQLLKSKLDLETRLLQGKYNQSRKGNKF